VRATTGLTVVDRVAFRAAVRRLNHVVPRWRERVDPDRLDMMCADRCVLGQVFGDYGVGLTVLGQALLPDLHDRAFGADFPAAPWLAELANHRPSRPVDDRDPVGAA
jgi:hypothetical protein